MVVYILLTIFVRALQWWIIVQMYATPGTRCMLLNNLLAHHLHKTFLQIFDLHKFARKFEVRKVIESHR